MSTTPTPAGTFEAVVATYNVVDHDGDILIPGCVEDATPVVVSGWGHSSMTDARVPIGIATLHSSGNELRARGKLFLDVNPEARAAFAVIKEFGENLEWSFGFQILQRRDPSDEQMRAGARRILTKLDAFEISGVIRGAGRNVRTVAVKRAEAEKKRQDAVLQRIRDDLRASILEQGRRCQNGYLKWRHESENEFLKRYGLHALVQ